MPGRTTITGLAETRAALRRLGRVARDRVAIEALTDGGEIVADAWKQRARRETGEAAESIHVAQEARFAEPDPNPHVFVGPDEDVGYRLRFAELGTIHEPARPAGRPALEETEDQVLDAVAEVLRRAVDREVSGR